MGHRLEVIVGNYFIDFIFFLDIIMNTHTTYMNQDGD